jgi:hypothetical protein
MNCVRQGTIRPASHLLATAFLDRTETGAGEGIRTPDPNLGKVAHCAARAMRFPRRFLHLRLPADCEMTEKAPLNCTTAGV